MNIDLESRYLKDVEVFSDRYGRPINIREWDESLVRISLNIAKDLFLEKERAEAGDGAVLFELSDGSLLALTCLPDRGIGAFATRIEETYFVTINYGVIRLLFDLSLSIWRDQRFIKYVSSGLRSSSALNTGFVPPGFEELFLHKALNQSSKVQQTTFYQCFEKAISFFWLHEIAHILLGHIDICSKQTASLGVLEEFLDVADFDDDDSECLVQSVIPYSAFEIQADRWALDSLFTKLHTQIIEGSAGAVEFISTAVGCTLFPISLHGYNLLRDKPDKAKYHPPLWFRADEVLKAEDTAANRKWFNQNRGDGGVQSIRSSQRRLIRMGVSGLSSLHPMYGDWLSPISGSLLQTETEKVLEEARINLKPWVMELAQFKNRTIKDKHSHE